MLIFLGVVQLGVSYIIFSNAIRHVSALDAIIYPVIEPIFNPIFAFLFLGESMSTTARVGGALVILGVVGRGIIIENYLKNR
jgi:drug/metabolite transporter (DMT)-like permease